MADAGLNGGRRPALRGLFPQSLQNWRETRFFGRYGEIELHFLKVLCRRDADAIDVGADSGTYVHYMRPHARRVIAYEPLPESAKALGAKFGRGVSVEAVALSDRAGTAELRVPVVGGIAITGCATLAPRAAVFYPTCKSITVPTARLDAVYQGRAGLLKIQVEGHEQAVLEGAIETIRRDRPRLLVKIDERLAPGGLDRARAFLAGLGYDGYFVHNNVLKPVQRFSIRHMQYAGNLPDLVAPLRTRERFGRYICNFLFLPADEPLATLRRIAEELEKRRDRPAD